MTAWVREYRKEDEDRARMIWSVAFRGGESYPPERTIPLADEETFVAIANGRVAGAYRILSTTATCRGRLLNCGGISAVAVAPEDRKRHVGSEMMTHAVKHMHETGQHITNLRAAHEVFYRRYGWESCGRDYRISCPVARFPRLDCPLPVRQWDVAESEKDITLAPEEMWPEVNAAYEKFSFKYSGMAMRKSFRWSRIKQAQGSPARVYAVGDPVEAYMVIRFTHSTIGMGREMDLEAIEFVWSTPVGYRSLLSTFAGVGINFTTISWPEPSNGPFLSSEWFTRGMTTKLANPSLFRILDVPGVLRGLSTEESGTFTMVVDDEILPANRGPWRVCFSQDGVEVEPTGSGDLKLDIRQVSQAILGEPSLTDLLEHGFVKPPSEKTVQAATTLLSPKTTYSLEYF
ncbi:MAG: GNAT family N-acetyltransferase [Candidatus Poribacteria bacterium]|nr:GNAT family N-acetyltransferase [Candidatus Poribacteria bacterium]MDE0502843.1 GNAT family N-acetyltransferase [Candidatus Poribacteria bacterium]